jgi:hypothetical protein
MEQPMTAVLAADNGGRRRLRDRRFLVTAPFYGERRTRWERRSGYDRRLRRVLGDPDERRAACDMSFG